MVLGYDEPRPTRIQYDRFLGKFVEGLRSLGNPETSLMVYGSYVRGDFVPVRSDIDAVLVLPGDVVTDKSVLADASLCLSEAFKEGNIPFQVTVTDLETMRDGRFSSYNPSFRDYFEEEGEIAVGEDKRQEFSYEMPVHPDQGSVIFNLRKSRQGLLFSEHDRKARYPVFVERFTKALNAASRGSKQMLHMSDGRVRKYRFAALDEIREKFSEVNPEPLAEMRRLYENPALLDELYRNPEEALRVWRVSLTFFEEMIRSYIRRHPRV